MLKKFGYFIIISFLVISLVFINNCGKKEKEAEKPKTEEAKEEKKEEEPKEKPEKAITEKEVDMGTTKPKEGREYALQIAARKEYSKVVIEQEKLEKYGYKTKITATKKDGEIFYRLRLRDFYTAEEAKMLGEKIKKQFPSINDYWVVKVE